MFIYLNCLHMYKNIKGRNLVANIKFLAGIIILVGILVIRG